MKPAVCFFSFLCTLFLFAGRPVHASHFAASETRPSFTAKTVISLSGASQAAFSATDSGLTSANPDPDLGVEDEDEEQEQICKPGFVVNYHAAVFALGNLPPPVSTSNRTFTSAANHSLIRSCRYLAHRALRI